MPANPTEQLPWYHEHPFDDTRVLWKLWLLTRSEDDLHSLRSSFQSWSELWYFFATYRDGFVKDIPHDMIEAYREEIERYTQRRRDASPYTPDGSRHNPTDDLSPSKTRRGRAAVKQDRLTSRSPKSILTRTRSQSPAKNVRFNADNLEQYEPVRSSSKSRISIVKHRSKDEKKRADVPQRHAKKRRMHPFVPSYFWGLFSGSAPPPPDDECNQQEEEAYLEASSALTAARLASLEPTQKAGRGRKALKPLLDDDNWSLSVGPRSPLKFTRSTRPASPRTTTTALASSSKVSPKKSAGRRSSSSPSKGIERKSVRRTRSASPAGNVPKLQAGRGRSSSVSAVVRTATRKTSMSLAKKPSADKMARTRSASPVKKSLGKRTSSRSRSTSPGLKPLLKRVARARSGSPVIESSRKKAANTITKSASTIKAKLLDNTQLPTPRSSPKPTLPITPRTRRRSTVRGLTKVKKPAPIKKTSGAKAKSPRKVRHISEEPGNGRRPKPQTPSLESEGTSGLLLPKHQNYQGRSESANPSTHDRHGTELPYDAFSQENCLYDIDKHDPDYLSLLGLDETEPNVSPYDADFHFASELHIPLDIDQSKFDIDSIDTLLQDNEVRISNRVVLLRDTIKRFALWYFAYTETEDETVSSWRKMVRSRMAVRELVMYVGYVGDCGDKGEDGWDELLSTPSLRVALVCGIIWKIVKERVLDSLLFGATEAQTKSLAAQEKSMVKLDGFARTAARADQINTWYPASSDSGPPLTAQCTTRLAIQLQSLLIRLDPHTRMEPGIPSKSLYRHSTHNYADAANFAVDPLFRELRYIVNSAATLNQHIRTQPDVVFYWVPVYKGMEYELERMTCANLWPVQRDSPFNDPDADVDPDVKALIRVVCFHGLTSYRRGGGDLARYMLEREKRKGYFEPGGQGEMDGVRPPRKGEDVDVESGFRSRVLAKAIVALSWGVERPIRTGVLDGNEGDLVDEEVERRDTRFIGLLEICNDDRIKEAAKETDILSE